MNRTTRALLCTLVLTAVALPASAATIVYRYTGSWISNNAVDPQELGGASFDLTWTVDMNALPASSSATSATYEGELNLIVSGSPGDVDGTYVRNGHTMTVSTDFNGFGYLSFSNVRETPLSPVPNFGNFIILPLQQITFGVFADTSLPVGDFTADIEGIWGTGTAGGGSYSATITELSATVVPLPAAAWLLGSGCIGLFGMARRRS